MLTNIIIGNGRFKSLLFQSLSINISTYFQRFHILERKRKNKSRKSFLFQSNVYIKLLSLMCVFLVLYIILLNLWAWVKFRGNSYLECIASIQ